MGSSSSRSRYRWLVGLVAVVSLAGCANNSPQPEADPGGIDTSAPPTDTEGPPPDNGGGGASVDLPSAPVGGQSTPAADDPALQCLSVNWLAGDDAQIPDGATVTLGDFSFDPAVFDVADGGCESDGPDCTGFSFTAAELSCTLPVRYNGQAFDPNQSDGSASVVATATCPDDSDACTAFLTAVVDQPPSQLGVTLPPTDSTS